MTTWTATGPANIALIKYMGKAPGNLPTNISLSYTLDHLITTVTLSISPTNDHIFQCQPNQTLSPSDQQRFLNHLQRLTDHFAHPTRFTVQSKNNFPSHCGIASSASSFCALTRCAIQAMCALCDNIEPITTQEQAMLSRLVFLLVV